jgi:hypothetical protein
MFELVRNRDTYMRTKSNGKIGETPPPNDNDHNLCRVLVDLR